MDRAQPDPDPRCVADDASVAYSDSKLTRWASRVPACAGLANPRPSGYHRRAVTEPKPVHVLPVDDDPEIRAVLVGHCNKRGWPVDAVADGLEALTIATRVPLEIVVTDLEMPGLGGIELIRRLRLEQPMARVIVMSGHATLDSAMECLSEGAFTMIAKPLGNCAGLDRAMDQAAWVLADWRAQMRRLVGMPKT